MAVDIIEGSFVRQVKDRIDLGVSSLHKFLSGPLQMTDNTLRFAPVYSDRHKEEY